MSSSTAAVLQPFNVGSISHSACKLRQISSFSLIVIVIKSTLSVSVQCVSINKALCRARKLYNEREDRIEI